MWARENGGTLEVVNTDPTGKWADGQPFYPVDDAVRGFVTVEYKVEDGKIVPPSLDYLKKQVKALLADYRYIKETGGLSFPDGTVINTQRESQAKINEAYSRLKDGLIADTDYKTDDGGWVEVTLAEITPIATAVTRHVRACFKAERETCNQIDALTSTDALLVFGYAEHFNDAYAVETA